MGVDYGSMRKIMEKKDWGKMFAGDGILCIFAEK